MNATFANLDYHKVLPLVKAYCHEFHVSLDSALDIGCGLNPNDQWFKKFEYSTNDALFAAVEPDERIRQRLKDRDITFYPSLTDVNRRFKLCILTEVLEHIPLEKCGSFLQELEKTIDGIAVISVPNYEHWPTSDLSEHNKQCRWWPDFAPIKPHSASYHDHKHATTPESVLSLLSNTFSADQYEVRVYRAWPWMIHDLSRNIEFKHYFKVFASIRKL